MYWRRRGDASEREQAGDDGAAAGLAEARPQRIRCLADAAGVIEPQRRIAIAGADAEPRRGEHRHAGLGVHTVAAEAGIAEVRIEEAAVLDRQPRQRAAEQPVGLDATPRQHEDAFVEVD